MRNRLMGSTIALAAVLAFSPIVFAQNRQQTGAQKAPVASNKPFDAHDISGIWLPTGFAGISNNRPPMTDWGKAKWSTTKSAGRKSPLSYGFFPDQKDWNDPFQWCDPTGYPRDLWYGGRGFVRIVQTPADMLEFFEQSHFWRDMWTDGRTLPSHPEPRWFGYSVGRWDGDTFVVEATGFDDRTWLDLYGSIHSDQMKLEERYRRVDHDRVELTMTLTDPIAYTAPWVSDKKVLKWADNSDRLQSGLWGKQSDGTPYGDIREDICVWSETKDFYSNIDPAGDKGALNIGQK